METRQHEALPQEIGEAVETWQHEASPPELERPEEVAKSGGYGTHGGRRA